MQKNFISRAIAALALWMLTTSSGFAQVLGQQNFVVLRVQFHDMVGSTFNDTQTQGLFDNITTLWGTDSSYGAMTPNFRISPLFQLPKNTASYVDQSGGTVSSTAAFNTLVSDAVAGAPATTDWSNLRGLIILFADTRTNGFHRGVTYPGVQISPAGVASFSLPVSVVSEDPLEGVPTAWGRIAHEIGHEMQQAGPPHPSNYNSQFEQMDAEYPGQTGVFEKQANMGFPAWLSPGKYRTVNPPKGAVITLLSAETPPNAEQDVFQAAKVFLNFGGTGVYYLVSVRRRVLGDDIATGSPLSSPSDCTTQATPNGIPDCGVMIERVVEGGDPNVQDCDPVYGCTNRWVDVLGKGGTRTALWHVGDTFDAATYGKASAASDGVSIRVLRRADADHYTIEVTYGDFAAGPDVGLQSWLQPPGDTYETTDIWIDSPVNGYASPADSDALHYRYGIHADLLGGVVPTGNGDDPAVGVVNRLYARVRNYGTQPATNVTVFFDITNPPGLGINGSNGFVPLGSVGPTDFPGLASIPPGGSVDVYLEWTPNFTLTPQQIAQGIFAFHTCVRVRLSHVSGETFFANQDGDGQQENIDYFDATGAGGAPGAPGPANGNIIHLRNDSPAVSKTFSLGLLRDTLPAGWSVAINGGAPVVTLGPNEERDIPVAIRQDVAEAVGSRHRIRVIASSQITFVNPDVPTPHDEARVLGGVTFEVGVVRKPTITCHAGSGSVTGLLSGVDPADTNLSVYVSTVTVGRPHHHGGGKGGDDDDQGDRPGDGDRHGAHDRGDGKAHDDRGDRNDGKRHDDGKGRDDGNGAADDAHGRDHHDGGMYADGHHHGHGGDDGDDGDGDGSGSHGSTVTFGSGVLVPVAPDGSFSVASPGSGQGVCLFAGSLNSAPAGSAIFGM